MLGICTTVSSNGNDLNANKAKKKQSKALELELLDALCKFDMHVFGFLFLASSSSSLFFHYYSLTVGVQCTHSSSDSGHDNRTPVRNYYGTYEWIPFKCSWFRCSTPFIHKRRVRLLFGFFMTWFKNWINAHYLKSLCGFFTVSVRIVFADSLRRSSFDHFHSSLFLFTDFASAVVPFLFWSKLK